MKGKLKLKGSWEKGESIQPEGWEMNCGSRKGVPGQCVGENKESGSGIGVGEP